MKHLLLYIFITCPLFSFGQKITNSLGVVTLSDEYSKENGSIKFLNNDETVWCDINLYDEGRNWSKQPTHIMAFHPDYFLFKLKCVSESADYYTVVVHEGQQLTKRIKKNAGLKLVSWEEYVLNVFSISFDSENNPALMDIDGTPATAKVPEEVRYTPMEIKGEWMKIRWSTTGWLAKDESEYAYGWIKWKHKGEITIRLHFIS